MTIRKQTGAVQTGPRYDDLTGSEKQLLNSALKRGASRREAMQLMVAAGVSVSAAGAIVTSASDALAATPKKGGTIKAATHIQGPDDTLDPARMGTATDYSRGRAHYNGLVQLSDDIVPRPELAEYFEVNKDATEWTFKLRKDVEWHDGSKFTADDVIYTMNRHYGEKSTSVVKSLVKSVKEWKKVGPHEVKAICETPYADLAAVLGEKQFKIIKDGTTDFNNPVGTGPYKLEEYKQGIRSRHVRNENYWREGANLDAIEIFGITDPNSRVSALLAGDVQLAANIDPKSIPQVEAKDNVEIISIPSGSYMGICLLATKSPGNNPDFVMAMKLLQRRDRIVKTLLKGHGTVGNDQPINVAYGVDFCEEIPIRAYDPDQAKSLIKKSGITEATIQVAEVSSGITDACLMMQRECAKIGFNLQIQKMPTDGFWGAVWQKSPMNVTAWNMRPTATIMLDIAYHPEAPWSDTWWKSEKMGELLAKAKAETDQANRHVLQCQMQKLVSDEAGVIIPAHRNIIDGKASNVRGMPKLALGQLGGNEWPEFAWLDS
ncbi:MAG: ABC transporter substrate-binding protein [Rhizobiales bacterium]|nr:ABC transporter substrate-binding protein [Hyphomicrobiales bacterium]